MTIKTTMTKQDILLEYNEIIKECDKHIFMSSYLKDKDKVLNREDFRQFINGLYQAEGTMGMYFPKEDSLRLRYSFSIGQNYSSEAAKVFLNLRRILGVGSIKLEFNTVNKVHIRYKISNTNDIFSIALPYFSLLYGQKHRDRAVLLKAYKLSCNLEGLSRRNVKPSVFLINELINLVYSINPEGQERKLTLIDKLALFNCKSLTYRENLDIKENNNNLPSKLFIIGLFLGDGSFGFVFDNPPLRSPRFYIKIVFNFAAQSYTNSNIALLELVAKVMELEPQISIRKCGMIGLEYSGETVYKKIMPFLLEHYTWLFWRKKQFINVQKIAAIFKEGGHLEKDGLKQIIYLLYEIPNKYRKPKEFWLDLIDKRFNPISLPFPSQSKNK